MTLGIAIACRDEIVVATDSRRSGSDGSFTDATKKLFLLPGGRVATICGLVDVTLGGLPEITAKIPCLIDGAIERTKTYDADGYFDTVTWNESDPSGDEKEDDEFARVGTYGWWEAIAGPIQTIYNIAATFSDQVRTKPIQALVVGFRSDGRPKFELLTHVPAEGRSSWGRRWIGARGYRMHAASDGTFLAATIGVTELADSILLSGHVPPDFSAHLDRFPRISDYVARRASAALATLTSEDALALAEDLIKATALLNQGVGAAPIQKALLRTGESVRYEQPVTADPPELPKSGAWNMGVVFTSDYPFSTQGTGAVFTDCVVSNNVHPIPLTGNMFFGSRFENALFTYDGGPFLFGPNNQLTSCELRLGANARDNECSSILEYFDRVVRA